MPSPFPGMNPFLEQEIVWHDFHLRMVAALADALSQLVRPKYLVRIDNYLFNHGPRDVERHRFIDISTCESRERVSVIEMLSPSNKDPKLFREQYLVRRSAALKSTAHLVEIDLLRGSPRMSMERAPECDYSILVGRADQRPRGQHWPVGLRDPLPAIPIPLRPPDPDAVLDLQTILHQVYDHAGYDLYIYSGEPEPPLSPDDAKWAASLIPSKS